ncbi:MAG: PQQ-binding-like beta-propeller repeat protein [Pirellulaceae bacterium]|nr:PQQ-binding-like beta-propeller repeat protein [Pirellulaceae bacterium]
MNNWTRFRGANGLGVLEDCSVSLPWKPEQVLGQIDLPAFGNGSPVIWGSTAFLLCGDQSNADRYLVAVDIEKPRKLWEKKYASSVHKLHVLSSFASSTPCVDAKQVYCAWGSPESLTIKAFTHDGQEVWSRDLGRYETQHGFGTSPIIVGDLVVLFNSQDAEELPAGVEPGTESMIALDRSTGATVWETPLKATRVCYGVPCVTTINDKEAILCSSTGSGFFALDAKTGTPLWSPVPSIFEKRVCSSLLHTGSLLISTEGSGGGGNILFAVKDDGSQEEVYRISKAAPYVPTPIAKRDMIFLWADNGVVSCLDAKTGSTHWSERIGGDVSSSPVILGDSLIGISRLGVVTILAADKTFQKLGEVAMEQTVRSTPAATKDRILIRSDEQLWVIAP